MKQSEQIPEEAILCISGLSYLVLKKGTGKERPGPKDIVRAIVKPLEEEAAPIDTLYLNKIGAGLAEAFQLMNPGQKLRVWIPVSLQEFSLENSKPSLLIYDLELLDFHRTEAAPNIPNDLISPSLDE